MSPENEIPLDVDAHLNQKTQRVSSPVFDSLVSSSSNQQERKRCFRESFSDLENLGICKKARQSSSDLESKGSLEEAEDLIDIEDFWEELEGFEQEAKDSGIAKEMMTGFLGLQKQELPKNPFNEVDCIALEGLIASRLNPKEVEQKEAQKLFDKKEPSSASVEIGQVGGEELIIVSQDSQIESMARDVWIDPVKDRVRFRKMLDQFKFVQK